MSSNIIWFIYNNTSIVNNIDIINDNSIIIYVDFLNKEKYHHLIKASIDCFNSEIFWDEMWDMEEANIRLSNNHILFLLLSDNTPIGHVWYNGGFLYNAFVSSKRKNGISQWFIQETMKNRFDNGFTNITLYTEKWNTRAINFWLKIGFTEYS